MDDTTQELLIYLISFIGLFVFAIFYHRLVAAHKNKATTTSSISDKIKRKNLANQVKMAEYVPDNPEWEGERDGVSWKSQDNRNRRQ